MKQIIIQKALSNIHSEKNKHQEEYARKMHDLFADKNYEKLDKELTKTVIENARKQANNLPPDLKKEKGLQQKIETLKKQYHLENVQMEYSCPLCKDAGYIDGQMCKCLKKEVSNLLLKESGFENLEDFSQAIKTSGKLEECFSLMKKWCHSDFKKNLIYISGPTGVGKTHLVKCMAKELIERGKFVKIVTAFAMNQDFKEFSRKHDDELLNKYLECEILFVDDLGTEPLYRNVTVEYLYLIINERKMKKLPTVITSNLDLSDLMDRYDERISSRIIDRQTSITIYMDGQDRRLKNK